MRTSIYASAFIALGISGIALPSAHAATYAATQDTSVYEFLGNLGAIAGGSGGDAGGLFVWNHESVHGVQSLIQFDSSWMSDSALGGEFTATLNLYAFCEPGGFVSACPGFSGAETTTTDVLVQGNAWNEANPGLGWSDINAIGPSVSFTQDGSGGWISIDVTSLVQMILDTGIDFGFVLSQESQSVIRDDNGSIAVSTFCDSESSGGLCATGMFGPTLEIRAVPLPAAVWLFGTALGALGFVRRRA